MGLFNKVKDSLTTKNFDIDSSMKVIEICKQFKKTFQLSLRIYKGKHIVTDGRTTLKSLDKRTTKTSVDYDAGKLKIRATQKVGEVEDMFLEHFGLSVQIADIDNKKLVDNNLTLGEAKRDK